MQAHSQQGGGGRRANSLPVRQGRWVVQPALGLLSKKTALAFTHFHKLDCWSRAINLQTLSITWSFVGGTLNRITDSRLDCLVVLWVVRFKIDKRAVQAGEALVIW